MGLFQKKPIVLSQPFYSLDSGKPLLIVGLGNPEKKYLKTRHNLGFMSVEAFAEAHEFPAWSDKKDLKGQLTLTTLGKRRVILLKPSTYMNLSGQAVQAVRQFYRLEGEDIIVVYDELDIPFGQLRTRLGGSAAGHNGVKSVIEHIGENFGRVRIGIGPKAPKLDSADFVLGKLTKAELTLLPKLTREVTSILTEAIFAEALPTETRTIF